MYHASQQSFEGFLNEQLVGVQIILNDCWDELSNAQQFSAMSISEMGYNLSYIRCTDYERVAVFTKGSKSATISSAGLIDMSPDLKMYIQKHTNL